MAPDFVIYAEMAALLLYYYWTRRRYPTRVLHVSMIALGNGQMGIGSITLNRSRRTKDPNKRMLMKPYNPFKKHTFLPSKSTAVYSPNWIVLVSLPTGEAGASEIDISGAKAPELTAEAKETLAHTVKLHVKGSEDSKKLLEQIDLLPPNLVAEQELGISEDIARLSRTDEERAKAMRFLIIITVLALIFAGLCVWLGFHWIDKAADTANSITQSSLGPLQGAVDSLRQTLSTLPAPAVPGPPPG